MRILIVANGEPGNGPPPGRFDQIVAADGGAGLCRQAGLQPDLIVGDMDSLPMSLQAELQAAGCRFQVHPDPVNKDETDLELAILAAVTLCRQSHVASVCGQNRQPSLPTTQSPIPEIVLWGIWGGRPDHILSNVLALAHPALAGITVSAYANGWWLRLIGAKQTAHLDAPVGTLVSLIPLTARVTGIFTTGLYYPLPPVTDGDVLPSHRGGTLRRGLGRGISNVIVSRPATIQVGRGLLLVAYGPG